MSLEPGAETRVAILTSCHRGADSEVFKKTSGMPILTIGLLDSGCDDQAIIQFRLDGKKLRFLINHESEAGRRLKFGAQLLRLAGGNS